MKTTSTVQSGNSSMRAALSLCGWILICFLSAAMGALFSPGEWFAALNKPSWNPPAWLFAPIWSALYLMMAVAAWLVQKRGGWTQQKQPLIIFLVQLALNAIWSPLFFGLHSPVLAFVDIVLLWFAILTTLISFWRASSIAGWLLVPYLAWVTFAAFLNFDIWKMNS